MLIALVILMVVLVVSTIVWSQMYLGAQAEISALTELNLESGRKLEVTRDAYLDLMGQHETLQTRYVQTLAEISDTLDIVPAEVIDLRDMGEVPCTVDTAALNQVLRTWPTR